MDKGLNVTQQTINVGSAPNDGTGDPARTAFQKTNANFTDLYASLAIYGQAFVGTFTATLNQTVFTLPTSPGSSANLTISVDGATLEPGTDYNWTTPTTLTFTSGLPLGAVVLYRYTTSVPIGTAIAGGVSGQLLYNNGGIVNGLTMSGDATIVATTGVLTVNAPATHINYTQGGTGSVTRTVTNKLQESVSVKDFGAVGDGATNDYTAFVNAFAAIPATGGILRVPAGTYYLGLTGLLVSRNNITVIGDGMPRIADNRQSLTGGTILQGTIIFDGNGITLSDFGVDAGTDFVTARFAGAGQNALVVHNVSQAAINKNTVLKNLTGLCKIATSTADATAAVHAVLLESLQYGYGDNLVGCGGWYGVVMKVSDFNFGNITGRECDNANVYLKSDTYGPVARVNIANIVSYNVNTRGYSSVFIQANSSQLQSVTIGNISSQNPTSGVNASTGTCVRIDAASTNPAVAVSIANITTYNGSNGIYVTGPIYGLVIDNAVSWSGAGVGFQTGLGTAATQPLDVTINNFRAASFTYGAVYIASGNTRVILGNVNAANTGGAIDGTSSISIQNNTSLGQYYGTLQVASAVPTLLNGWAVFSVGQAYGVISKGGTTSLYGRIKATGATNDIFMTIPAGMAPNNLAFYTGMTGYNGITTQLVPVTVFVDASGNASIYPNRAAYAATISWFNLTDLKFPTEIPSTGAI